MRGGRSGTFYISGDSPELTEAGGCTGWLECFLAATGDASLLLLGLTFLLFVTFLGLIFIPEARTKVEHERKETKAERDAFHSFASRTREIPTSEGAPEMMTTGPLLHRPAGKSSQIKQLSRAFQETVMEVPHFDEYEESLEEHMAAEFGTDLASGVLSSDRLTDPVKRSIIHAAVESRDRRQKLLDVLDIEERSLENHERILEDIEREIETVAEPLCSEQSYKELEQGLEMLQSCRETIDQTCLERQHDRQEAQLTSLRLQDNFDLQQYLYKSMDVTYPVLAEATRLVSNINTTERRIEDELIYRN